jgi:glucosamine-6-phosphate deaminase
MENRTEMGEVAAKDIHDRILFLLSEKETINMIFAAAPSQNDVLCSLIKYDDIEWNRINAFHMDEYIGLGENLKDRSFSTYLTDHIFGKVPFKSINLINSTATDAVAECERYTKILNDNPTDIVVMGIGENGHIAFNDPHVAEFNDKKMVKKVSLDNVCRMQQVHDGCFEKIEDVPEYAVTLTIPTLMSAKYNFCVVPAKSKAEAVKRTVCGEISEECPATIMRTKDGCIMYCDMDSSALISDLLK